MSVYDLVYTQIYSEGYTEEDQSEEVPVVPPPAPDPVAVEELILYLDGYLQTTFMDAVVTDESQVRQYSSAYMIRHITELSGFMGGKRVNGNIPVSHFTMNGADVVFSESIKDWIVFWSVCVTTVNNVMNTYGIETRLREQNTGLQLRAGRMKYVAGNAPYTNFDDQDTGTVARLAKAESQNVIGLKNITLTLQLP